MSKLFGYIIAAVGLAVIILSLNLTKISIPLISNIKPIYIIIAGIILVVIGVFLSLSKGKSKQAEEEVPIYHGKKIVGYRRGK